MITRISNNLKEVILLNTDYNASLCTRYAKRENIPYVGSSLRIDGFNAIQNILNDYDIKGNGYNYLTVELFTRGGGTPSPLVTQFKEYPESYETTDCTYTAIYKIV